MEKSSNFFYKVCLIKYKAVDFGWFKQTNVCNEYWCRNKIVANFKTLKLLEENLPENQVINCATIITEINFDLDSQIFQKNYWISRDSTDRIIYKFTIFWIKEEEVPEFPWDNLQILHYVTLRTHEFIELDKMEKYLEAKEKKRKELFDNVAKKGWKELQSNPHLFFTVDDLPISKTKISLESAGQLLILQSNTNKIAKILHRELIRPEGDIEKVLKIISSFLVKNNFIQTSISKLNQIKNYVNINFPNMVGDSLLIMLMLKVDFNTFVSLLEKFRNYFDPMNDSNCNLLCYFVLKYHDDFDAIVKVQLLVNIIRDRIWSMNQTDDQHRNNGTPEDQFHRYINGNVLLGYYQTNLLHILLRIVMNSKDYIKLFPLIRFFFSIGLKKDLINKDEETTLQHINNQFGKFSDSVCKKQIWDLFHSEEYEVTNQTICAMNSMGPTLGCSKRFREKLVFLSDSKFLHSSNLKSEILGKYPPFKRFEKIFFTRREDDNNSSNGLTTIVPVEKYCESDLRNFKLDMDTILNMSGVGQYCVDFAAVDDPKILQFYFKMVKNYRTNVNNIYKPKMDHKTNKSEDELIYYDGISPFMAAIASTEPKLIESFFNIFEDENRILSTDISSEISLFHLRGANIYHFMVFYTDCNDDSIFKLFQKLCMITFHRKLVSLFIERSLDGYTPLELAFIMKKTKFYTLMSNMSEIEICDFPENSLEYAHAKKIANEKNFKLENLENKFYEISSDSALLSRKRRSRRERENKMTPLAFKALFSGIGLNFKPFYNAYRVDLDKNKHSKSDS